MFSLTASSQTDIDSLQTNETHHLISTDVLRAMIKDIRIGDGNIRELEKKDMIIDTLEAQIDLRDSIIFKLDKKIINTKNVIKIKDEKLSEANKLSDRLQRDLKKERLKTKLTGGLGVAAILGSILILK